MEIIEFQNETQGPSTSESRANAARNSSAQDDRRFGDLNFVSRNREFASILRLLAECRMPNAECCFIEGGTYEL
jgi:hypothetical protein